MRSIKRVRTRRKFLKLMAAAPLLLVIPGASGSKIDRDRSKPFWGYAIDTTKCIGCCACMRGCQAENHVPVSVKRTWIERYHVDAKGGVTVDLPKSPGYTFAPRESNPVKAYFVGKICNHCEKSVCTQVCPVGAAFITDDGVALVDHKRCIGCGYCVQACPYGTRFINPETHLADKCTLCYHRIKKGLKPACVTVCPTHSRIFGNLNDPKSELSIILKQRRYRVLRPEMGTHPKCYYLGLDSEVI